MKSPYRNGAVTLHRGDCLDVLRGMPDNSVDALVTDPPYGLSNTAPEKVADAITRWACGEREFTPGGVGFMGQAWDAFVPPPAVWDECLRVLKPGGHLVVFAGSRTVDLMGISLRLAGADLRDSIMWVHGQGFPKGGSQLKPAQEPILLARKPFKGSTTANVKQWGTGALNIDATRIEGAVPSVPQSKFGGSNNNIRTAGRSGEMSEPHPAGRWPANVVLDPVTAEALDQQSGNRPGFKSQTDRKDVDKFGGTDYGTGLMLKAGERQGYNDEGGASRFFKVVEPDPPFMYAAKAPKKERPSYVNEEGKTIQHSTVKPLSICRWLAKLTCPPGGTILDPFAGSGTTIEAAMLEGFNVIGIEREADYLPLIQQRIDRATEQLPVAS